MAKQITAIIVGAGHRALLYSLYALQNPEKFKIVGVADPDPIRRRKTAEMHGFGEDMCFESAEALAERPRLADAVINGTMDTQHVKTAVPLLRRGYDMLLEKPFAVNEDEMWELQRVVGETGRRVMICHVLRYAPFYVAVKERLLAGEIVGYAMGPVIGQATIADEMFADTGCHDPRGAYQSVFSLAVHPDFQRRGYGRELLNALIRQARAAGRQAVTLTCRDHKVAYYESFGFHNQGVAASVHGGVRWYDMLLPLTE